jgi:anti-sigma regulatory factor (Ser/Thr protein kinase)
MPGAFPIQRFDNRIAVNGDFQVADTRRFFSQLHQVTDQRGYQEVVLDFADCTAAFSSAMLPVCANVSLLREKGFDTTLILPSDSKLQRLFLNTGWANLLEPANYPPPNRKQYSRQFPVAQYKTHQEQEQLLNELLEKLLAVIPNFSRSAFAAVEWALNEISDNVINHSQSPIGGLLQLSVFDSRYSRVEFTVADAGIGVPQTLRAAHPDISTDADALMESVRSGVTRNKTDFQGNGLYGTLEICRIGGGKFSLNAGYGVLFTQRQTLTARNETIPYCGTTVDALIDFSEPALLEKALAIDGTIFRPTDYIELKYEQDDQAAIPFILEEQATSFRSRPAGKPVNIKLGNLVRACPGQVVQVDFSRISVVSSSFADEVFGKLFVELGPMRFMQSIRLIRVSPTVQAIVDRAITTSQG